MRIIGTKEKHIFTSLVVLVSVLITVLFGPGFLPNRVVIAQSLSQEEIATEVHLEDPTQTPVVLPTDMPTETPVEIPTEIPTDIPADLPTDIPTDVPINLPTEIPTETPTEIVVDPLIPTPTPTSTEIIAESPTPTATLDLTPTITATPTATETSESIPFQMLEFITLADGSSIEIINIDSPPIPPEGTESERQTVDLAGSFSAQENNILNIPAYRWVYGCSAVSAAMIAGYYDNNGYSNIYTGPANGGQMPYSDTGWPSWSDGTQTYPSNPLIASKENIDGRSSFGSINDYWVKYNSTLDDPFIAKSYAQHSYGESVGDFMRTSQSAYGNVDGSTKFYNWETDPSPLSCDTMAAYSLPDGSLGLKSFFEARGYSVSECYNQKTDNTISGGFSFAQYKAQIQAGHPVLLNLYGHTVVGVGYDDASQKVYLHDTWDFSLHEMAWGGSYAGMTLQSVGVVSLPSSKPSTPVLISPLANLNTNAIRPTFVWGPSSLAASYTIQISRSPDFSDGSILVDETVFETIYSPSIDLTGDGAWYWRVKAIDSAGVSSSWTSNGVYILDTVPPEPPIQYFPGENATPLGIPTFSWLAATGANAYQFEYDDNNDFSSVLFTSPDGSDPSQPVITANSYKPVNFPVGVEIFWHVKSRDAAGNWSIDWSLSRSLVVQASLPIAPILTTPAIGYVTNVQPALSWNSVPTGATYQVQIFNNKYFTGSPFEDRVKESGLLSHTIETPLVDGIWYWRVRAINSTHGVGAWSTAFYFYFDSTPPMAPALYLPQDNAVYRGIPAFSWYAATGANAYQFQIDDNADFSSPVFTSSLDTPLTVRSYTPTGLTVNAIYYWRVRARDAIGNWGVWEASPVRSFSLLPVKPAAPWLTAPAIKALTNNTTPTFSWNAVTDGYTYQIQVDNLSTFASPEYEALLEPGVLSVTPPVSFTTNGAYYWRVRAFNVIGEYGIWSTLRYFTIDTIPPLAPALYLPANNTVYRGIPSFSWYAATGANAYQFQIDDDQDFSSPIDTTSLDTPLTARSYKPASLTVNTTYFWQVRARDIAGNWAEWTASPVRSFSLLPVIPAAPVLTAPAIKLLTNNTTPTFSWNAVVDGDRYHIQIDNISTFTSPEYDSLLEPGVLSITPPVSFTTNGIFYWRVQAVNINGEAGTWSILRYFTIDTIPPLAPALYLPATNTVYRGIPAFSWYAATGANAYQFQIDDNQDFSSPVDTTSQDTPLTVRSYKPIDLSVNTTYYWRVRARDIAGNWAEWTASPVRSVSLLPVKPIAPVLTAPASKSLTNNTTPTFSWNAVVDGYTYHIQIDNLSTFASPEYEALLEPGVLSITPPVSFTTNGYYYWRVQAVNINGESGAWSILRYFTIDTIPPLAPALYLPRDNTVSTVIPYFSWYAAAGANAYQFQIDDNQDFSSPVHTSSLDTPLTVRSYKPTGLSANTTYYWRVCARDIAGNWNDWAVSPARSLRIQ